MISHAELLLADGRRRGAADRRALSETRPPDLHPLWGPWRSLLARAAAAEGDQDTASRLAGEELALARRSAAPWVVGRCLRQLGELTGDAAVLRGGRAAGRVVGAAGASQGARGAGRTALALGLAGAAEPAGSPPGFALEEGPLEHVDGHRARRPLPDVAVYVETARSDVAARSQPVAAGTCAGSMWCAASDSW